MFFRSLSTLQQKKKKNTYIFITKNKLNLRNVERVIVIFYNASIEFGMIYLSNLTTNFVII